MQDPWTKPYCGVSHNEQGTFMATICDYGTFVHAYIIKWRPLNMRSLVEKNLDSVAEAKAFCEKLLGNFNAA